MKVRNGYISFRCADCGDIFAVCCGNTAEEAEAFIEDNNDLDSTAQVRCSVGHPTYISESSLGSADDDSCIELGTRMPETEQQHA